MVPESPRDADGSLLWPAAAPRWGKLRNVLGVAHNPLGVPPFDAHGARLAMKTHGETVPRESYDERARECARIVCEVLLQPDDSCDLDFEKGVSQGAPDMSKDELGVHAKVNVWLTHSGVILRGWAGNDMKALSDKFGVVNMSTVTYRFQPDDVTGSDHHPVAKDRLVYDWLGNWLYAERDLSLLPVDFVDDRFVACRARKLNALSFSSSWPLRIPFTLIRQRWSRDYSFSFYNPYVHAVTAKLARWRVVRCYDFGNHDVFIPTDFIDVFCDVFGTIYGPAYEMLLRDTLGTPQAVKADYYGKSTVRLDGHPFDRRTYKGSYVNPSGHPGTSVVATIAAVVNWFDAAVGAGLCPQTKDGLIRLLLGSGRVGLLVQGDNTLNAGADYATLDAWERAQRFGKLDRSDTFLGKTYFQERGALTGSVDITSYILGFYCPSRPVGQPLRGHWATGWLERQAVYRDHHLYEVVRRIEREVVGDILHLDIEKHALSNRPRDDARPTLSLVDREFLLNPDVVKYKYNVADLSPDIRLARFTTLYWRVVSRLHKEIINAKIDKGSIRLAA